MTNFFKCANTFREDPALQQQWGWNGPIYGLPRNRSSQISYPGCRKVCGTGPDVYSWTQISGTILTWCLPVLGVLLQGPFESNATWATLQLIARWMGSPIAALSQILRNIHVISRCAFMVDMATSCENPSNNPSSVDFLFEADYTSIRDSLYILTSMNQFAINPAIREEDHAIIESLLRITLFSESLGLRRIARIRYGQDFNTLRANTAKELRARRKKGIVAVFISTGFFLFAFIVSIQSTFGLLSEGGPILDLSLSLLLGWLPILILSSIVDRNPSSSHTVRTELNKLVSAALDSLRNDFHWLDANDTEDLRAAYIRTYNREGDEPYIRAIEKRITAIQGLCIDQAMKDGDGNYALFEEYAGQARLRFHFGVGHSILKSIETSWLARRGRTWLKCRYQAQLRLLMGDVSQDEEGIVRRLESPFKATLGSEIFLASNMVLAPPFGAFVVAYETATVGLGCRSGSYLIYMILAFIQLCAESLVWTLMSPISSRHAVFEPITNTLNSIDSACTRAYIAWLSLFKWQRQCNIVQKSLESRCERRTLRSASRWIDIAIMKPIEAFNAAWLVLAVCSQTFGWFNFCWCQCSVAAGSMGGYMDFNTITKAAAAYNVAPRLAAAYISIGILGLSLIYLVLEWCLQSHLNTEDYEDAQRGLWWVRIFRRIAYAAQRTAIVQSESEGTLVWSWHDQYQPGHHELQRQKQS